MLIAADWAEGFLQAIALRVEAWDRLFKSKHDGQFLYPILALCGDENGESLLDLAPDDEDLVMEEAAEFIPSCITAIAAYWRRQGPKANLDAADGRSSNLPARTVFAQDRPKRAMPLRLRQKVQKMLRQRRLNKSNHTPSVVLTGCLPIRRHITLALF